MNKKILSVIIAVALCFSIVGCGKNRNNNLDSEKQNKVNQTQSNDENKNEEPKDSNAKSDEKRVEFETKTILGNKIDSSIFKDHKITMIDIWSTYCEPCKKEMPELQELYEELESENIDANIISIVEDASDDETIELAKNIIEKKEVTFVTLIPDEKLNDGVLTWTNASPTTIFVDSEGKVISEVRIGTLGKEKYKEIILESLESLK